MSQDFVRRYAIQWIGIALLVTGFHPLSAHAEWMLSVYGGGALTLNSDARLKEPGDARLTFHDVRWDSESLESPQYYGLRLTYWLSRQSPWGLAVDFVHAKMIADLDQEVLVTGRRGGGRIDVDEGLGNSFEKLEFSHGHNLLTANVFYRWPPPGRSRATWLERLQPYVGFGAGVALPHVEIQTHNPVATGEYQLAGPALQGLAGIDIDLMKHLSLFVEIRLSYVQIGADLDGGGSLETDALTYHLNIGFALSS